MLRRCSEILTLDLSLVIHNSGWSSSSSGPEMEMEHFMRTSHTELPVSLFWIPFWLLYRSFVLEDTAIRVIRTKNSLRYRMIPIWNLAAMKKRKSGRSGWKLREDSNSSFANHGHCYRILAEENILLLRIPWLPVLSNSVHQLRENIIHEDQEWVRSL